MIAIRKLTELLEKDSRGLRPRPGAPSPTATGGGDSVPIELPHHFEQEPLDDKYPR
jgi:hypothetical protein